MNRHQHSYEPPHCLRTIDMTRSVAAQTASRWPNSPAPITWAIRPSRDWPP